MLSGLFAMKYLQDGHRVRFLSMLNGCGGHHILGPDEIKERRRLGRAIAGSAIPGRVAKLGLEYEAAAEFYLSKLPAGPRKMIKGLLSKP